MRPEKYFTTEVPAPKVAPSQGGNVDRKVAPICTRECKSKSGPICARECKSKAAASSLWQEET